MDKESILKLEFYFKEQHINHEVDLFYADTNHRALFEKHIVPLLEQEADCGSIRSLESFISSYLRDTNHVVIGKGGVPINTLALYLQRIRHDFSRFMDPVGRREKKDWKKADGSIVKTTTCQLKYFKFFIEYELLLPLLDKYRQYLQRKQTKKRKQDDKATTSKKKKDLTTMYVYVVDEVSPLPSMPLKPDTLKPATMDQNWERTTMESLMYVYEQQELPFAEQEWHGEVME